MARGAPLSRAWATAVTDVGRVRRAQRDEPERERHTSRPVISPVPPNGSAHNLRSGREGRVCSGSLDRLTTVWNRLRFKLTARTDSRDRVHQAPAALFSCMLQCGIKYD